MLVLTRKQGESFLIGEDVEITLVSISGDKAKIAINAPKEVKILRKELFEAEQLNLEAATTLPKDVDALKLLINRNHKNL